VPPQPPAAPAGPARPQGERRSTAFTLPGSLRLKYNVNGESKQMTYNARGELLWLQDGASYDARLEVGAFMAGTRTLTSAGRITTDGLKPTRFADKARREFAAHFEYDKGQVIFSANTPEATLLAGAQDRLSVMLQLGAMQTIGPRDADTWVFRVEGEEKLNLSGNELLAIKLTRNPRREFDQKVELWLAPSLGYLPARMRLTEQNGDFVDQQLRSSEKP
jgi:hypothetical protein